MNVAETLDANREDRSLAKPDLIAAVRGRDAVLCLLTDTIDAQGTYACTYGDDEPVTCTRTYTGLGDKTITYAYYPNGSRKSMHLPVAPSGAVSDTASATK